MRTRSRSGAPPRPRITASGLAVRASSSLRPSARQCESKRMRHRRTNSVGMPGQLSSRCPSLLTSRSLPSMTVDSNRTRKIPLLKHGCFTLPMKSMRPAGMRSPTSSLRKLCTKVRLTATPNLPNASGAQPRWTPRFSRRSRAGGKP